MNNAAIQVIKIGGSLLDLVDLPRRLRDWLESHMPGHRVLVVGGGQLVEIVRQWHRRSGLDETAAHWACIDLMAVNRLLLGESMREIPHFSLGKELYGRICRPGTTFFDATSFMRQDEPRFAGKKLPQSWAVTSDSIAGRLAIVLGADRLVLLKSNVPDPAGDMSLGCFAARGYVDAFLPELAEQLPRVEFWNIRAQPPHYALASAFRGSLDTGLSNVAAGC